MVYNTDIKINELLLSILNENKGIYNRIVIPVYLFNLLEKNKDFENLLYLPCNDSDMNIFGKIYEYDVCVDLIMEPLEVVFTFDSSTIRGIKIDNIILDTKVEIEKRVILI